MPVCASLRLIVSTAVACCCLACGGTASAEIKPTLSVSQLLDAADVIVLARPAESVKGGGLFLTDSFVVEEVLRGAPDLKAERIFVDLRRYDCRLETLNQTIRAGTRTGERIVVRHALLFLRRPKQAGDYDYEPVQSGVRYLLTNAGIVLVPVQGCTVGPYGFRVDEQTNWDTLLADLREVLPIKNAMHAVFSDPGRSSQWVEVFPSCRHGPFALRIMTSSSRGEPNGVPLLLPTDQMYRLFDLPLRR